MASISSPDIRSKPYHALSTPDITNHPMDARGGAEGENTIIDKKIQRDAREQQQQESEQKAGMERPRGLLIYVGGIYLLYRLLT